MAKYSVDDIRNVTLTGHGAAGKTSLTDAMLFHAGAVDRLGKVDDGTSFSDFDEEEKKRKNSIYTTVFHLDHKGHRLNLLDTPGYPDFAGAAYGAMDAVETVVVVISATGGIQVNTRRMYREAERRELARMIVINRLDTENVQFQELIDNIQAVFGKSCVLFNAPDGLGGDFKGVINLLHPPENVPDSCPVDVEAARAGLIEAVVEVDEELMMKYLEEGGISDEEFNKALPEAIKAGTCVPIFCTSAKEDVGVQELLDALAEHALSPTAGKRRVSVVSKDGESQETALEPKEEAPTYAQVFKSINDKFVGNLSFLRVSSGKLNGSPNLFLPRTGKSARTSGLISVQGKEQESVEEAIPGDIIAVAKVEDLHIGDTVRMDQDGGVIPPIKFPMPMFGLAVEPKARGDEQKISSSLTKVAEEDPTFHVNRDSQTHELVITGISQLHLDVVQSQLKRRYDLEVITHEPKVPYRETISMQAEASHRHKKQSGGRGQFGEVHLRIFPIGEVKSEEQFHEEFATKTKFEKMRSAHYDAEHNFGFIDTVVGGSIPNQFIPAIEKGCKELLERGALAGYRIQDVALEVHFGKDHPVDSSEAAFKTAGRLAFKKAFLAAAPVLLEPIVDLEVTIPSANTGDTLSMLNTKRGRIEDQDNLPGDIVVLRAKAPLAEVTRLSAELGSLTGGQGSYSMELSHYEAVPPNVQQQIVAKSKVEEDEED